MGFLDETGLARFLDKIKSHYVENAEYCTDCNVALSPGRYYIDANTANAPEASSGIMLVESKGGSSDSVWQTVTIESNDNFHPIYCRKVIVAFKSYSSSSPWKLHDFRSKTNSRLSLYGKNSNGSVILCPPTGRRVQGLTGESYEILRLYNSRDVSRDGSLESYGFIGRWTNTYSPTSLTANQTQFIIGESCGGITGQYFYFAAYHGCYSNVTYTDDTSESVRGVFLKAGDIYNGKTVASVEYQRDVATPKLAYSVDNKAQIGDANNRFAVIYAATGSIDTSDERLKESIENIPDEVLDAWGEVGWVQYQFKDAVADKGKDARLHSGMIAQRIDAVFKSRGLDASRYGLFCYDVWEDEYDMDENGVQHKVKDAGDRYSLRYEEALAMEAAYQRRKADRLEARIAALEARLDG